MTILALIALSTVVVPSAATASSVQPAAASTSVLTKSAQDLTHPGANPVNHGDTLNWVVSYADGAGTGSATITDPITGAGVAQTYTPGSLQAPPGWTTGWSTDGSTFTGTEPATGTVAVRATNPDAHNGGTDLARQLLPPVQTTATATGGDGFTPIIYRTPDGDVQAWNTFHHQAPSTPKVVCSDLLTGHPCAGGPWPRPLNTAVGPLGAGSTGDIQTVTAIQYAPDPSHPSQVYYPAVTTTTVGVGCLDLLAQANCGYYPLESTGGSPYAVNSLAGVVATAGNLYGVDTAGRVLCLNIASHTACAGQPYAPIVTPNNASAGCSTCQYLGALTLVGSQLFAASSPTGASPPVLGCFDPATATTCVGWATPRAAGPAGSYSWTAFTSYTTSGVANGVCTAPVSGTIAAYCYAPDGSALTGPTSFAALPSGALTFNPKTITAANGHLESYFGSWGGSLAGGTTCWDWTSAARCASFPAVATHPGRQRRSHA